jgi:endonuclease/exonuclease/phosphatase family metal-dependent hydrolase
MNERVTIGVRTLGAVALAAVVFACASGVAQAQTTVVLDAPGSESIDTMVRGGSYASKNYGSASLETRASSDLSYVRRALMKFDTETRIPAKATINAATLTLTVKAANAESRKLAAYRIVYSFDEGVATWTRRKSGISWAKAGGDFGSKYAEATVSASVGSKVTFDVTKLVQESVNGSYGSRWTRIGVVDPGASSGGSWREYYSSEASTASLRPTLTVVYGGSSSSTGGTSSVTATSGTTSAQGLPSGWSSRDIGAVGRAGTVVVSGDNVTMEGAGADVWGSADALHFVYRSMSGDGTILTRVAGLEKVDSWTKAGVMMRETTSAGSRHAFMLVSAGNGSAFQRRASTGGSSSNTSGGSGTAPYWVKLTRSGSTFTAYKSSNGSTWTRIGSQSISMASTIYVGLAVSSHASGTLATARFDSTVVAAGAVSAPAEDTTAEPETSSPTPDTSSGSTGGSTGSTLKVLQWNVHHGGIGTDGRYDPARVAAWIAKMNPHVASLNEVDTSTQVSAIVSALQSKSGVRWYTVFSGRGNLVISRVPLDDSSKCLYAPSYGVYGPQLNVVFNGRRINLWSAHLHVSSASSRLAEAKALQSCAANWSEARIIAGDYNMQYGSTEYKAAATNYTDGWLAAKSLGATANYSGNCDGCTRNSRIDYVFSSKGATFLKVKSAQIVDTRDSNGKMPSDHKPLLMTFTVN